MSQCLPKRARGTFRQLREQEIDGNPDLGQRIPRPVIQQIDARIGMARDRDPGVFQDDFHQPTVGQLLCDAPVWQQRDARPRDRLLALSGGVGLSIAAWSQARRSTPRNLPLGNTLDAYGRVSRMIHWTTAILFICLIPMGIFTSMIPEDATWRNAYYVIHKSLGFTVFGLVLARLLWNLRSPRPAPDHSLKSWETKLAKLGHRALYVLLLAVPITGFVMTTYHGFDAYFFGLAF